MLWMIMFFFFFFFLFCGFYEGKGGGDVIKKRWGGLNALWFLIRGGLLWLFSLHLRSRDWYFWIFVLSVQCSHVFLIWHRCNRMSLFWLLSFSISSFAISLILPFQIQNIAPFSPSSSADSPWSQPAHSSSTGQPFGKWNSHGALKEPARETCSHSKRSLIQLYSDIVKVRLQTTTQYSNALDAASRIFKNEGPAAFYKVCVENISFCWCWGEGTPEEKMGKKKTVDADGFLCVNLGDVNAFGGNRCLCKWA